MTEQTPDHPPVPPAPTPADARHVARIAAVEQHQAAAQHQASILLTRTKVLIRNGVDLRNPERMSDYVAGQVIEAIEGATVNGCGCSGAQGPAALALIAELARQLAEATR